MQSGCCDMALRECLEWQPRDRRTPLRSALPCNMQVNAYTRKSPLRVEGSHLSDMQNIQEGDCIVAFSKMRIYDYKKVSQLAAAVQSSRLTVLMQ